MHKKSATRKKKMKMKIVQYEERGAWKRYNVDIEKKIAT